MKIIPTTLKQRIHPTIFSKTQFDICHVIEQHLNHSAVEDYALLTAEAQSMKLYLKKIWKYVDEHTALSTKMTNAKYPSIEK